MTAIPWYPIIFALTMLATAGVGYFSSQISLAEELGARPTRDEMNGHIEKLEERIVQEVKDAKEEQQAQYIVIRDQQKETRQDIRDLRQIILERLR